MFEGERGLRRKFFVEKVLFVESVLKRKCFKAKEFNKKRSASRIMCFKEKAF